MSIINPRLKKILSYTIIYLILIIAACFFLMPVYVLIVTAFKTFKDVDIKTMWYPSSNISLVPFNDAIMKLAPNLLNSLILAIPATIFSAFLGSINGYLLSKWKFKGANLIFVVILFGMFIPYQSILIPLVQVINKVIEFYKIVSGASRVPGIFRIFALIFVHVIYGLPITTLIFRNYYTEVPNELIESGFIDGCGMFKTYFRILLPLSAPGLVVVIIWQFTNIWNEFLFAVTIVTNTKYQPITVALQNLAGSQIVEWNVQMAGAVLTALPTLFIYIFLGRYFIRGLLAGSVKG